MFIERYIPSQILQITEVFDDLFNDIYTDKFIESIQLAGAPNTILPVFLSDLNLD